jgi:hypothetical protein
MPLAMLAHYSTLPANGSAPETTAQHLPNQTG